MKKYLALLFIVPIFSYSQQFITGGYPILANQAPYQASLQLNNSHQCGCSILNNEWLITAAHCITSSTISNFTIRTGITDLLNPTSNSATYNVNQIIVHPNYNSPTASNNDIALIKISGNINFNADTQPILLGSTADNLTQSGQNSQVSGWGWIIPGSSSGTNQLNMVNVPVISNAVASSQLDISSPGHPPVTANMIATGSVGAIRQGACHGDSGGPLVALTSAGVLKQIGIVSWGVPTCVGNPNSPSIYAKVENFIPWINQYVSSPINIAGSNSICGGGIATYNLLNNVNNNTVTWSLSQNLSAINTNSSSITITPILNATNGQGTITATVNGQNYTKTIWVGKPTINFVDFTNDLGDNEFCVDIRGKNKAKFVINTTTTNILRYHYKVFRGTTLLNDVLSNNLNNTLNGIVSPGTIAGSYTLKCRIENACGWSDWEDYNVYFDICVNSQRVNSNLFTIYPNPSSQTVFIDLIDQNNLPAKETVISGTLFDLMGQIKSKVQITENKANFSVQGLEKGVYVLKIYINGEVEAHQIIVD